MGSNCDFSGYATRYNTRCTDGRTIRTGAFADMDGKEIPIVWNHNHSDPSAVIGKGILHSVRDGLRVDGWFSNTKKAKDAKENLQEGVPMTFSIHATNLKQKGAEVAHGIIREVSLVLAGANPGAVIDHVSLAHSDGFYSEEEAIINWEEPILFHSADYEEDDDFDDEDYDEDDDFEEDEDEEDDDFEEDEYYDEEDEEDEDYDDFDEEDEIMHSNDPTVIEVLNSMTDVQREVALGLVALAGADDDELMHADTSMDGDEIEEVLDSMTDEQLAVTYGLVGEATPDDEDFDDDEDYDDEDYEEEDEMAHNVFDREVMDEGMTITVDDQRAILEHAMESNCGSFQTALKEYFAEHEMDSDELMHGFSDDDMEYLFPDFKDPAGDGEPWTLTRDQSWIDKVMDGAHKTPFSRIKTRYIDATGTGIRARGYKKGDKKEEIADVEVLHRETTPQTIYVKDSIDRDDKVDFTEFGIVAYQNKIMTMALREEAAIAILFGDGRDKNDANKIKEDHIRPIWTDDETYTIHQTIDLAATKADIQGSATGTYFGENYIWAESFVNTSLYAREKYKGSGNLTAFMTPHTRNVMLLARDRNGRRIYSTVAELTAALDVKEIVTVEQMEGLVRTAEVDGEKVEKKLLCLMVNMSDYNIGATKGGEITSFEQFDIDFNKEKYLKEARFSGALTRIKSAIVIEEDVTASSDDTTPDDTTDDTNAEG